MNDYLSKDVQKQLLQHYRAYGFKRFHYMNAAIKDDADDTFFVSYWTVCLRLSKPSNTLIVYPFMYDKWTYQNSPTTDRQCNRWLRETFQDPYLNVKYLRRLYEEVGANKPTFYSYGNLRICFSPTPCYGVV